MESVSIILFDVLLTFIILTNIF